MTRHRIKSEVGVRELHARLSRYVDAVRDGAEVVVTKRGRQVARLAPIRDEDALELLIRNGRVTSPSASPKLKAAEIRRARARGSVSELAAEQRR